MFDMEDLPVKPQPAPKPAAPAKRRTARPPTARQTTESRRKTRTSNARVPKAVKRPVKPLPPMRGEAQPRDHLGRFARKVGAGLWGAAKGTGRAIAGTVKGARKLHRKIKHVRAAGRRRANLEAKERRIALAEREKKLGIRKKRVVRRRHK